MGSFRRAKTLPHVTRNANIIFYRMIQTKHECLSAIQPTEPCANEEHRSIPSEGTINHHYIQTRVSHSCSSLSLQLSLPVKHPDKQRSPSCIKQNSCDTANTAGTHTGPHPSYPHMTQMLLPSPGRLSSLQKTDSEHSPMMQEGSWQTLYSCRTELQFSDVGKLQVRRNVQTT